MSAATEKFLKFLREGDTLAELLLECVFRMSFARSEVRRELRVTMESLATKLGPLPESIEAIKDWMVEVEADQHCDDPLMEALAALPPYAPKRARRVLPAPGPLWPMAIQGPLMPPFLYRLPSGVVLNLNKLVFGWRDEHDKNVPPYLRAKESITLELGYQNILKRDMDDEDFPVLLRLLEAAPSLADALDATGDA